MQKTHGFSNPGNQTSMNMYVCMHAYTYIVIPMCTQLVMEISHYFFVIEVEAFRNNDLPSSGISYDSRK